MRIRHYLLLLFSLSFLTYLSSFGNQFVWDDEQFIYNNVYVLNFQTDKIFTTSTTAGGGVNSDYYRPLTTLSFAIDANLWGLNPVPFHIHNTLLHTGAGLLLFLILLRLKLSKNAAFTIAAIFLLHPLQTEAVTYINSRGDSLYTFFALLSALLFCTLFTKKQPSIQLYNLQLSIHPAVRAVIVSVLYLASILSKEIGIASLGIMILIFIFEVVQTQKLQLKQFWRHNLYPVISLAISTLLVGGYLLLRATALNFINTFNLYNDGSLYAESVVVRLLTFSKVVWIYFRLLFFPYPLHMERSTELVTSFISVWPFLTLAFLATSLYLAWREFRTKQTLYIFFGLSWFFGMLAPVSGIIPINGILYEHWLYLPIVGFLIFLYGVYRLLASALVKNILTSKSWYFLIPILSILAILTIRQNYFWATPIRFYEYLLQYTSSARIYSNLGMAYAAEKNYDKAIASYQKSLKLSNAYPQTHHNLGNAYKDSGQIEAAITSYQTALQLNPQFMFSYQPLFNLLLQTKDYVAAEELVNLITTEWPNDPTSKLFEVSYYLEVNNPDKAAAAITQLETQFPTAVQELKFAKQLYSQHTIEQPATVE